MNLSTTSIKTLSIVPVAGLILALVPRLSFAAGAEESAKTFDTPEAAVAALECAAKACDGDALRALFGEAAEDLQNPDRVQATNELNKFTAALVEATASSFEQCVLRP